MAFKDNEKDTFSFDDLAGDMEEANQDVEVKGKKGLFNKKKGNSKGPVVTAEKDDMQVSDGYFSKPESIAERGEQSDEDAELEELFIATSSASAISDLVSKNNDDVDSDDEGRRKKLIAEIESELNGNSGKTGAIKTVNKPVEKPVSKPGKKIDPKKKKKPMDPMDAKEQLLAQRQMELDNIMKEIGVEEGTFNTKTEEQKEEEEERKEMLEKSKVEEHRPTPQPQVKKPVQKKGFDMNNILTTRVLLVIGIVVCILVFIGIFIYLILNKDTSNNAVLTLNDKITIKSPANKYVMTFGEVNSRASVENIRVNNGYEYFTKIKVKVKNKKKSTANMRGANEFVLIGVNNEKISTCLTSTDLTSYNASDALPSTIPAKSTVEGYLYCKTDITYKPKLQITALREIDETAAQNGELVGLSAYTYTVNLDT